MRKFFKWLFKIFRPDPSGYVKNIQDGSENNEPLGKSTAGGRKKAVNDKELFYWLPISKIRSVSKNDQGLTSSINISPGAEYYKINYEGDVSLKVKKQGLSRVNYRLEITPGIDDELAKAGQEFLSEKKNISILHIDKYGDGFLYGEVRGLSVLEFENGRMILEGAEESVFYEITRECVQATISEKE